jgi:DNA polymerase-3 subunit delta'
MALSELFADLIGQPLAVRLLEAALRQRRLAPAYLFSGPEGVGRRLAALRFLEGMLAPSTDLVADPALRRRLLQGNHPDLLWVEPTYSHQGQLVPQSRAEAEGVPRRTPPQLRLEQVRELSTFLTRRPVEAERCLVVLEAAEAMAEAAANALLKTLEEPGGGLLVLLSAAPEQLLSTIRSRCQTIPFRRLSAQEMLAVLASLPDDGDAPGDPPCPDPAELVELGAGSPGGLLEHRRQWRGLGEGLATRLLALGPEPIEALHLARDLSEGLEGSQQFWLIDWLQLALWRRRGRRSDLQRLERLRTHLRGHVQPRLAWEVALLELAGDVA